MTRWFLDRNYSTLLQNALKEFIILAEASGSSHMAICAASGSNCNSATSVRSKYNWQYALHPKRSILLPHRCSCLPESDFLQRLRIQAYLSVKAKGLLAAIWWAPKQTGLRKSHPPQQVYCPFRLQTYRLFECWKEWCKISWGKCTAGTGLNYQSFSDFCRSMIKPRRVF